MEVVIFDIEASCDDKNINPNYNMETIEIGAVKVKNGKVIDEFETFIKPEYVDKLTPFCTELTGITFADLENAPSFSEGILKFYSFMYGTTIYSCGEFDRKFLTREILDKGLRISHAMASNAINSSHVNLKKHFSKITGERMKGMVGMARDLNIELTGTHHRALDDSRNLTKIYLKLEEIRERELKKVFNEGKLSSLLKSLNEHHDEILRLNGNVIEVVEDDKSMKKINFLNFLDMWSNAIEKDHSIRELDYLSNYDIEILNKYTKDLI